MALSLNINSNSEKLSKKFKNIESDFSRSIDKGIKQAGFQLLKIIQKKTEIGIDVNYRPFLKYSKGYLKKLELEGRPTNVDLFYSGKMLGSLTPNSTIKSTGKHKVTLAFNNAEMRKRALFNQVLTKSKRKFFGFNERTKQIIQRSFNLFMEKELSRSIR